jgi:hypothetical protein
VLDFESYQAYYEKTGRFPSGQHTPAKRQNQKQIAKKYQDYLKSCETKEIVNKRNSDKPFSSKLKTQRSNKIDQAMISAKTKDPEAKEFWSKLTTEENQVVQREIQKIPDFCFIDGCHILGKGSNPGLADNPLNIFPAPRAFHYYIDQYKNPFTEKHENISLEKHELIWRKLVGNERYEKLLELRR